MSSESTRPAFQTAQQFIIVGILLGLVAGICAGIGLYNFYIGNTRITYQNGAYPNELTQNYQDHYLAMTLDSYVVNQNPDHVNERLKSFSQVDQIRAFAHQSANYAATGRAVEAQMANQLAITMKDTLGWQNDTIQTVVANEKQEFLKDEKPAQAEAIDQFSVALLNAVPTTDTGQQPIDPAVQPANPAEQPPTDSAEQPVKPPQPQPSGGLSTTTTLCLVGLLLLFLVFAGFAYYAYRSRKAGMDSRKEIKYEGQGKPPIMQWNSEYTIGRNPYDESFTLETPEKDFLGEAGIGLNNIIPGSGSEKVRDFDVWVFDKTDINTYSRILMCPGAYNDEELRSRVEVNPLAEAVLAEPGGVFEIESQTMRVEIHIDEVTFAEEDTCFGDLKITMNIFLKDVEITAGQMDIPDHLRA